jgi:predicted DCC family thiol-disulfide oxidoreductase YuxK
MILYFVAGTAKLQGEVWVNGTALYYVMHTDWFGPGQLWLRDLFKNPWIVTLGTYGSVLYQIGFPFMIFSRWQLLWIAIGIIFHLGIAATMGLISFSTILIGLVLFTVSDDRWWAIHSYLRHLLPRLTVYIDGYCSYCRATGRWLEFFDLFGSLRVESFRHSDHYRRFGISAQALEREMHVVVSHRDAVRVYSGFTAVQVIVRNIPLLWGGWPLAWLLRQIGWGDRAYRWLAARRLLVADSQHCLTSSCTLVDADTKVSSDQQLHPSSVSSLSEGRLGSLKDC